MAWLPVLVVTSCPDAEKPPKHDGGFCAALFRVTLRERRRVFDVEDSREFAHVEPGATAGWTVVKCDAIAIPPIHGSAALGAIEGRHGLFALCAATIWHEEAET